MRDIEKYSKEYLGERFEEIQVKYRRKKVLEVIKKYQPKTVLEIGCGMEPLFLYTENLQYTVVEPSAFFINNARRLSVGTNEVTYHEGFLEDVVETIRNHRFDMIICSSLLHEIELPEIMIKNIRDLCCKSTIVHINVPNAHSLHRLIGIESGYLSEEKELSERNRALQQNTVFDLVSMKELLERKDFCILEQGTYFLKPFTHLQMGKMMEHEIINDDVLDGFYNVIKYLPDMGSELFVNCKIKEV